jgi:hypothetical protein
MLHFLLLGAFTFTGAVLAQQEANPINVQYTDQGCVLVTFQRAIVF